MGIICRRRYRDRAGAAHVSVAQLVSQTLELVCKVNMILVVTTMVMVMVNWTPLKSTYRLRIGCRPKEHDNETDGLCPESDISIDQEVRGQPSITYLNTRVRAQVEIKFSRMSDSHIDGSAGRDVPTLANLLPLISTEEPGVMSFLDNNERNARPIVVFQCHTGRADGQQFMSQDLMKLSFGYAIAIEDFTVWLKTSRLIKLNE